MRVYIIPTKTPPHAHDIAKGDTLRSLQDIVGGFIETCAPLELREQGIELLANEEGLLIHLPYNNNLFPFFFVGTLVAVGVDREDECFVSLLPEQEAYLKKWLENLKG